MKLLNRIINAVVLIGMFGAIVYMELKPVEQDPQITAEEIYAEGETAGRSGDPLSSNPHAGSLFESYWIEGWHEANREKEYHERISNGIATDDGDTTTD